MSNDRKKCLLGHHSVWKMEGKIRQIFYNNLRLLCYLLLFYFMMFACLTLKRTLSVHCSHNKVNSMDAALAAACNITHPLTRIKRSNLEVIYAAPYSCAAPYRATTHPTELSRTLQWTFPLCSGGQNDDFRPLTSTLGGRGMVCRDKYVTSWDPS